MATFGDVKIKLEAQPESEGDTEDTEDDDDGMIKGRCYVPPGCPNKEQNNFGDEFESHFVVPHRLGNQPGELVEAVNDFHYAMINDRPRNEFYRECLRRAITPGESVVLEIGTGSGLLAMLAARLGAKKVVAIEASPHMAALARRNVQANNLDETITILEALSTELDADDIRKALGVSTRREVSISAQTSGETKPFTADLPDVLVSELFGTLLLGESALEYLKDARERLVRPQCRIVPPRGRQLAALVECPAIAELSRANDFEGLDLGHVNVLQDTSSLVFAKQYGFRFGDVPSRFLAPTIEVLSCDFARDAPGDWKAEMEHLVTCSEAGTAHCVVLFWEASQGGPGTAPWEGADELMMSTDPRATRDNFARDMQWGQGIQLLEDLDAEALDAVRNPGGISTRPPTPLVVKAGEQLRAAVRLSSDSVVLQFGVRRAGAA
jgi:protein arginine N-methyltransferase 7